MRTPTLLTGLTGIVAVLVLLYVGMTAMNLQPHITFGDPNARVASADTAPSQSAAIAPTVAPPSPSVTPTPITTPAPAAPQSASVPPATAKQPEGTDSAAAPIGSPPVSAEPPPAAASPDAAPVPAAANAEASPSSLPTVPPAITPAPPPPPVVAATSPERKPATAGSPVPSPPPAAPIHDMTPAASEKQPAPVERVGRSEIATSAEPTASDADAAISERMAPQSPASPQPPLVASVPTPTARPTQNAIDDTEVTTSAKPRASDGKTGQPDEAVQDNAGQDEARQDARPPESPDTKAPKTETAALAPQPEKPADEPAAIEQPNGALKPIDLSRPLAERAGILTVGGRSVQLAGIVPTDPARSCTGPNGKEWPCGTLARTALRSFLLGRTITCDVPDPAWKGAVTADCRFAKLSIGDWLARNGWAEPTSGSQFSAAADEARKAGRGVYGNDPRKKHESTLAPEPPKDDPLNPI